MMYARASPTSPGEVARYDRPRGERISTVTGASAGPATLPSNPRNRTGASPPMISWNTSARRIAPPLRLLRTPRRPAWGTGVIVVERSRRADALVVQVRQPAGRVVGPLERAVRLAVVAAPELVLWVMHGGVERLVPAELVDQLLDPPVVPTVRPAAGERDGRPEAHVDVQPARLQRVQRPRPGRAQPQGAQPHRPDADLPVEGGQEPGGVLHRDLHVLHHRLARGPAGQPVGAPAEPPAPVQRDQAAVHIGAPPAARPQPADQRVLHPQRPGAPEPVGIPPPQVV